MRWQENRGTTLVELLAGSGVALTVLFVLTSLFLTAIRFDRTEPDRFAVQAAAAAAVSRFVSDVRQATAATQSGPTSVTLTLPSGTVTYQLDGGSRQLVRQAGGQTHVLVGSVTQLAFYLESGGAVLRIDLTVTPAGGTPYRLDARAALRPTG
jgi:Tfp pilus assembly protein PilW